MLTKDLRGIGLIKGHTITLGEVDVGLSEGCGGVGTSTCRVGREMIQKHTKKLPYTIFIQEKYIGHGSTTEHSSLT